MLPVLDCDAYSPKSVDPPVEGLAKSIFSFGIGIVLLSKLSAVGIFWARTLLKAVKGL